MLRLYSRRRVIAGQAVARDAPDHQRVDIIECRLLAPGREPPDDIMLTDVHRDFGDREGRSVSKATLRQYDIKAALGAALRKGWLW
jgi:hypothetical protein